MSTIETSNKRKTTESPERTEKKRRTEGSDGPIGHLGSVSDCITRFRAALLPLYDKKNPNHVARMLDLQSGDMRHFENIVLEKLRVVVEPIKNPGKDSKKAYWVSLVNDLSNDSTMSLLTCVGTALWAKCGPTGDYKEGIWGGKTLESSKFKYGLSASSWSSSDRDANNQSEAALSFMKFADKFAAWIHEQQWNNPLLSTRTKAMARDKATEEWESKNTILEECGKPALPFAEELVRKAWFKYFATRPVRLQKEKETKKAVAHTEFVELKRNVVRGLSEKEKKIKQSRPNPYVGFNEMFTESYYKEDKIENPIVYKNYRGLEIPREKMLTRPMQHGDVVMTHCQPQLFEDSPQDSNGLSFNACEVWMIQFAKTSSIRPSNIAFEGGQEFPSLSSGPSSTNGGGNGDVNYGFSGDLGDGSIAASLVPDSPCDSEMLRYGDEA